MWKKVNGHLIPTRDPDRIYYRTTISKSKLEYLQQIADKHHTYINYLLENGLHNMFELGIQPIKIKPKPKDRIQFQTSYDKDLLQRLKKIAKEYRITSNDIIEQSIQYIDLKQIKKRGYRYRIEQE